MCECVALVSEFSPIRKIQIIRTGMVCNYMYDVMHSATAEALNDIHSDGLLPINPQMPPGGGGPRPDWASACGVVLVPRVCL